MYECGTDGSYKPKTGCGGYSAIILHEGNIEKKLYRGYKNTTNNRMELMGVLAALKYFIFPETITIYSDSQYVISSIKNKGLDQGIESKDESKKNMDLGNQIYLLLKYHNVSFVGVKGHNNTILNELADTLAQHAAECLNLPEDNGIIDN